MVTCSIKISSALTRHSSCIGDTARPLRPKLRSCTIVFSSTTGPGGSVLDKPDSDVIISKMNKSIKSPLYRVLLHNDSMNKREYVVKVLLKVVDGLTVDDAMHIMNEAHMRDVALVTVAAQETAEKYVADLRRNGLTSTLEPDGGSSGGGSGEA